MNESEKLLMTPGLVTLIALITSVITTIVMFLVQEGLKQILFDRFPSIFYKNKIIQEKISNAPHILVNKIMADSFNDSTIFCMKIIDQQDRGIYATFELVTTNSELPQEYTYYLRIDNSSNIPITLVYFLSNSGEKISYDNFTKKVIPASRSISFAYLYSDRPQLVVAHYNGYVISYTIETNEGSYSAKYVQTIRNT